MRKQYIQYIIEEGAPFRYWVTTYHDGVKIVSTKVWLGDEFDELIDKLEVEGYERACTKETVQKAKENYECLLARQLVEEVK